MIGSAALLGSFPEAPAELTASLEVDLYPRAHPEAGEKLEAISELSPFHETHGFWVDPVGPETAVLPSGWESRLVRVRGRDTGGATGWCLEVHDLGLSKLVAGRSKDVEFVRNLIRHGLVQKQGLEERLEGFGSDPALRDRLRALLSSISASSAPDSL